VTAVSLCNLLRMISGLQNRDEEETESTHVSTLRNHEVVLSQPTCLDGIGNGESLGHRYLEGLVSKVSASAKSLGPGVDVNSNI
jgi:hypothetical protein